MYTRVRNKALNRLERAAQDQKRSEGDGKASDGSVTWRSLRVNLNRSGAEQMDVS